MKYQIIYADPPWQYNDKMAGGNGRWGGAEDIYPTMALYDLKTLGVEKIVDENCILFLWATFPMLQEAIELMKSWGFKYKTCAFVWVKTNKRQNLSQSSFIPTEIDERIGLGRYTKANAELCLIATKGKIDIKDHSVRQLIFQPITRHSEKPAEARERIVALVGDLSRVELFARKKTEGWDSWGNEVESDINLEASE